MAKPGLFRSIRFRLAATYTLVVFVIAALVLGVVYVLVARAAGVADLVEGLEPRRIGAERGVAIIIDEGSISSIEVLVNRESLDRLRQTSMIVLAILFPASFGAGWIIAGRVLRPVGQITQVAREIQASDLSRRIRLDGPDDELKSLGDTFDEMLDRIEQGVEDQRRFIQDTSHELRNPLATMALNLDVTLDDPMVSKDELRETVKLVRGSVDRLSVTVDELMRFARRELRQPVTTTVDLAVLAQDVAAEFRAPAAARSVSIEAATHPARVRTDQEAIHAALANLAANAVRITESGGSVRCGSGTLDGWAWVGVRDDGPGIEEDMHRLIFQRNWSVDGSRLIDEPRTGLGLSIVRQVAEASGGRVTLESTPGRGSSFVIWLPRSDAADPNTVTLDGIHPVKDPFAEI